MGNDVEGSNMVMIGAFECASVPVICHIIDLMMSGVIKDKTYQQFAFDLLEANYRQKLHIRDDKVLPIGSYGKVFPEIVKNPDTYICKASVAETLKTLKANQKALFLTSNLHIEVVELMMSVSLGADWKDYFDICVCNCKKPLFQRTTQPFY